MNIFLFIALIFILTFLLGKVIEKLRIPWIFAALILGAVLSLYNPFSQITSSDTFQFLSQLGMYFLLFLVGLEIDLEKLKSKSNFILRSAFVIIFLEGIVGTFVVHFLFSYSWLISFLVSLSFATVGEAILVPILDEFGIINKPLGQAIIGIGTADDLIEIFTLILATIIVGSASHTNIALILISLALLLIMTVSLVKLGKKRNKFKFIGIESLFLFILFVFFAFVGVGDYASSAPLAALLAGVSLRLIMPAERFSTIESEIKSLTYGFFAPLFFVLIGSELNIDFLVTYPLLILIVVVVSNGSKLLGSLIMGRSELGTKGAILLGTGLSVRFSTSIIIIKLLFDNHVVAEDIYSVIVASSIVFKFLVPVLFSYLLVKWKMSKV